MPPSGTAVILFADIADSTALTERLGDAAFRAKARDLDAALRTVIREHAGTPIEGKLLGDGVLAVFTSARQAIEAALACARAGDDAGLPLHLGLHAGDVIREDNNVYGGAVNIASRISGLSAPGEVLVSDTVRSLARTSAGVRVRGPRRAGAEGRGRAGAGVGGAWRRRVMEPRIQYAHDERRREHRVLRRWARGTPLIVHATLRIQPLQLDWSRYPAMPAPTARIGAARSSGTTPGLRAFRT